MGIGKLEQCFYEASQQGKKYVGIKVQMQGFPKAEIIINENENFDSKFEYYKKAYNEDLTLKAFSGIKIIGFTYADSFQEIENDLEVVNVVVSEKNKVTQGVINLLQYAKGKGDKFAKIDLEMWAIEQLGEIPRELATFMSSTDSIEYCGKELRYKINLEE